MMSRKINKINRKPRSHLYVLLSVLALVALLVAGCGRPAVDADTPPTIRYGEDVCDECGMIISDERFAAGLVIETKPNRYEHRIFDDIGDMMVHHHEVEDPSRITAYFVHDYHSREWLDADQAHFVRTASLSTPMGYGLAAFADADAARIQAQEWEGEVMSFTALSELAPADLSPMHMGHSHK